MKIEGYELDQISVHCVRGKLGHVKAARIRDEVEDKLEKFEQEIEQALSKVLSV